MKRIFGFLVAALLCSSVAFGSVGVMEDGTYTGEATTIDYPSDWITFDGSVVTVASETTVRFQPSDFVVVNETDRSIIEVISASTDPGYEMDNGAISLVWGDAETSYAQVTFIVPEDYSSGGGFRVYCDQSGVADGDGVGTPVKVDFYVQVNDVGEYWVTSALTSQTPAATVGGGGSPQSVTLTVATAFSSLAAGDVVTLVIGRDNADDTGGDPTADLEVYYVEFYYSNN